MLEQHKKGKKKCNVINHLSFSLFKNSQVLKSAFENDYPNLHQSYAELKHLTCPALIIWGRNDQV
jgi:pimeloyl-ACP methyl ester carboxylesterase